MIFLFSTTLSFQGNPVGYHIFIDENNQTYFFKPTLYTNRNIYPPSFYAFRVDGTWKFEGLADAGLQNQAIEDVEVFTGMEPSY